MMLSFNSTSNVWGVNQLFWGFQNYQQTPRQIGFALVSPHRRAKSRWSLKVPPGLDGDC